MMTGKGSHLHVLGTLLLDGYELHAQFTEQGIVVIERL